MDAPFDLIASRKYEIVDEGLILSVGTPRGDRAPTVALDVIAFMIRAISVAGENLAAGDLYCQWQAFCFATDLFRLVLLEDGS